MNPKEMVSKTGPEAQIERIFLKDQRIIPGNLYGFGYQCRTHGGHIDSVEIQIPKEITTRQQIIDLVDQAPLVHGTKCDKILLWVEYVNPVTDNMRMGRYDKDIDELESA